MVCQKMGAHLVEIESREESFWLAAEFLMTGLLTLNTNYMTISQLLKNIFDINDILQILKLL